MPVKGSVGASDRANASEELEELSELDELDAVDELDELDAVDELDDDAVDDPAFIVALTAFSLAFSNCNCSGLPVSGLHFSQP